VLRQQEVTPFSFFHETRDGSDEDGKFELRTPKLQVGEEATLVFRGAVTGLKLEGLLRPGEENVVFAKLPKRFCKKRE